jgi:hypothetical protein
VLVAPPWCAYGMQEKTQVKDLLRDLNLGSSVAEHDAALERYFVETATFRSLIEDRADVIAGDKGTGKTALYRQLRERYTSYDELAKVEVLAAFNPAGAPVFQRLLETEELSEDQYIGVWKAYFLSLGGNYLLSLYEGEFDLDMMSLDDLLHRVGLRTADDTAQTTFSQVVNRIKRLFRLKSLEQTTTFSQEGMPVLTHRAEFQDGDADEDPQVADLVRHDDALRLLNDTLRANDMTLWLVVDRLDEAFQGRPSVERPALRALFRTYLDMLEFSNIRLKLFVRRDLFARIVEGGFVNLTHVNARRIDITWDEEDLFDLLFRRVKESKGFMERLSAKVDDAQSVFNLLFPQQVDPGDRKPTSWTWMMGRIRDGNEGKPPRNLIDLVLKAQESQLRREEREPRDYEPGIPLLTSDALKRGLEALSAERVQDTLLAEAGEYADLVERFRGGKAEHNLESLQRLLGADFEARLKLLRTLGFLEATGSNYKVPMIYRGGLNITQGKAFGGASDSDEGEDQ